MSRCQLLHFSCQVIHFYNRAIPAHLPLSDILGVLKPGEVFYKSSRRNLRQTDGTETDIMLGDVLVTRHPCKLPTDIQKVWASPISYS